MRLVQILLASILMGGVVTADEYLLAKEGYMPPVGSVAVRKSSFDVKEMAIDIKAGDQDLDGEMTMNQAKAESVEVLPGGKMRYLLKSKKEAQKMMIAGREVPGEEKSSLLVGVPVLLFKEEGEWVAKGEKGKLTTAQQKEADEIAVGLGKSGVAYGSKPRKIGETWEIGPDQAADFFGTSGEDVEGSVKMTLVEIVTKDGLECAKCLAVFKMKGQPEEGLNLQMEGKLTIYRSLKYFADMEVEGKIKMTMDGAPAEGVTMAGEGEGTMRQKMVLKFK